MIKLEVGKKYKTRNCMTIEIVDALFGGTMVGRNVVNGHTYDYKQNGLCHCGQALCDYDIISEVVENPINEAWKEGLKNIDFNSCFPEEKPEITIEDMKAIMENSVFNIGIKFGPPLSQEEGISYNGESTKQNTFTISVDLPQGTQSINLERTVSIEGVPYLANIKLEKM